MMESFDTSILNARSGLPNTVPMVPRANVDNSSVKMQKRGEMVRVTKKRDESTVALAADVQKRGEEQTEEECEADEDDNTDSDEEDCEEDDDSEGEDEDCEEEETSNNDKPAELPTSSIRNAAAVVPTSTSTITSPSTAAPAKPAADGPIQKPSNMCVFPSRLYDAPELTGLS
jgi:cobalamin biosynthesis protein CobT